MDDAATEQVLKLYQKAVYYDQAKKYEEAIFCYMESASRLLKLLQTKKCLPILRKNAKECIDRAEFLKSNLASLLEQYPRSIENEIMQRTSFLMLKAETHETDDDSKELSCTIYEQVIEACLSAGTTTSMPLEMRQELKSMAEKALLKAEEIRTARVINSLPDVPTNTFVSSFSSVTLSDQPESPSKSQSPQKTNERYSKAELDVLSATSNINNRLYVPFHSYDKTNEFIDQRGKFTDPDGMLRLTEKQKKRMKSWKRASELFESPVVIANIDSSSIKQTLISDCSFISSLSIAACYEKKLKKRLVTSIIYPQDANGKPRYNPNGKYMMKFHINGVWRKVVIDDYFPVDELNNLLCSHSQCRGELWVSLLEKAYMKVMGGYDFPGSNSNIDLNALTGWIPERISIRKDSKEFDEDKVFRKLLTRIHNGDCLVTLATGKLTKEQCDRAGLVETHAYAVLDMRFIEDKRLIQLKNPWTHLRWKGNYSDKDKLNWTGAMKKALGYDPIAAAEKDDGVFWIDYESVLHFFDVFYVNWNPELFPFSRVYHASWGECTGPVKDLYSVGENPQYIMNVTNTTSSAAVWIVLTRHITNIDDFADNKEYITVMVYDTGRKIYIPYDPKPVSDGVRINSPHYLCQILVTKPGVNSYTLVVAQYEKTTTIRYSLRVYSSAEVHLKPWMSPYSFTKSIRSSWDGTDQSDSRRYPTMKLTLHSKSDDNALLFELRAPKQFSVAIEVKQVSADRTVFYENKNSGAYRPGYTVLAIEKVPAGLYHVRVCTYTPGQKGPFILKYDSSCKMDIEMVR